APWFSDKGLKSNQPVARRGGRRLAAPIKVAWPARFTVPLPVPTGGPRAPRAFFDSMPASIVRLATKLKSLEKGEFLTNIAKPTRRPARRPAGFQESATSPPVVPLRTQPSRAAT